MKNVAAIYARLSREDENKSYGNTESKSIENQIEILTEYAIEKGLTIYRVYSDDGFSGSNLERPQFSQLLCDMKKGVFDTLLVKDISRIGRSLFKVGNLIENIFPQNNIRVISVSDKYDSAQNCSEETIVLKNFLNEYYLNEFKRKCKSARLHYAQTKHINYYPKFGYNYNDDGKEIIDNFSACIVKKIFNLIGNYHLTTTEVASILNSENIPTRSYYATKVLGLKPLQKNPAREWNSSKVWEIAKDYEYCGHSLNWIRHDAFDRILIKNTHLAIISEDLFNKTQETLKKRSKKRIEHLGQIIIDRNSNRNLLYSKNNNNNSDYYLRNVNDKRRIYSIKEKSLKNVLYKDLINVIENYKNNKDQFYKILKERLFDDKNFDEKIAKEKLQTLNEEYVKLLENLFNKGISESAFSDKGRELLLEIKEQEKVINSQKDIKSKIIDFENKFTDLIKRLKDKPKDCLKLISLSINKVYIDKMTDKNHIDLTIVYKFKYKTTF